MYNRVFVLDSHSQPLMPCSPARARKLMRQGRAAVFRRFPFTIILLERSAGETQPIQCKLDPGSKVTGIALVADFKGGKRCIWAAELTHRGAQVRKKLDHRRALRRSRRSRKTRYRKPRFHNRTRPKGWLAPSLSSRVHNLVSWVRRLKGLVPLRALSMELVRFDLQKLEHPEIQGIEYQHGELHGYEVKEYLLQKWGRECAYCGASDVPLEVEHIHPKSKGGTDRVSNLTLACVPCNQKKGSSDVKEFLSGQPERLRRVLSRAKGSLRDATAVNATRWRLHEELRGFGLVVECGSGGQTKYNRSRQGYRKAHWLDAVCVGASGEDVFVSQQQEVLEIKAMGRGSRQKCRVDRYGFARTGPKGSKRVRGFQTGDMVEALVPNGKKRGSYVGRVAVRGSGSFNIKRREGTIQGISHKYCRLIQRTDGYAYTQRRDGVSSPA